MKAIAITTIIITSQGVGSNGGRFWRGKNSSYLLILHLQICDLSVPVTSINKIVNHS